MKIVHIIFSLDNGGKENMMVDIANEQQKLGHKVSIVIINNFKEESVLNRISSSVPIFELHRNSGSINPSLFFRLFFIMNFKLHPDVINCHDISLGKLLKYVSGSKRVITVHGLGFDIKPLSYFDKIFTISGTVKDDIENRSHLNCQVVYNGINTTIIKERTNHELSDTIRIIQVSNLMHEYKGQDILIKAINILVNQQMVNNIHVDLVGEGYSRLFLEQLIEEYHLKEHVFLVGIKSREWVYEHLCDYDIFVQASRNEGFGLTVAEAMAAKLPVIAAEHDGPAEILGNGQYGLLFINENPADLALKIMEVVKLYNAKAIEPMIDGAYRHCCEHFDVRNTAANYIKLY
jgi:glycosyltransferase involved in cell wall biosynthesis